MINTLLDKENILWASQNRTLFYLASQSKSSEVKKIVKEGMVWRNKLTNTLKFINQTLDKKVDYLITRTYKYIPYVTFDVDLLIKKEDMEKVVQLFKKEDCKIKSHDLSLGGRIKGEQVNVIKMGLLTIDVHTDFTWQKRRFLDRDLFFVNSRKKDIAGVMVNVPSCEVEALLCLADITHERFNITMLDLFWLKGLNKENLDWQVVAEQAEKYGWYGVFTKARQLVKSYGKEDHKYALPLFLPLPICWLSYLENIWHNKYFPLTSFMYCHYTRIRYLLSGKKKMPFYDAWYKENRNIYKK